MFIRRKKKRFLLINKMNDFYTKIASKVLFPLHESLKGHSSVELRKSLEQSQWWARDKLEEYRVSRLRAFLQEVNRTVPYYKNLFDNLDFKPNEINSLEDLKRLPLLTKADIRNNIDGFKTNAKCKLSRFNTGGSTGEPLIFYLGNGRISHDVAAKWRATRWWGVDIGDREMVVWGSPIELGAQDKIRQYRDKLLRSVLIPAFDMSESSLAKYIEQIIAYRPKMLFGYPSSLALIAGYADKNGIQLDNIDVKVVFVTSERLYEEQKTAISKTFGCPVANGYGGRDSGFIAHQCPSGGMHISAEDIIVETVDVSGQPVSFGEPGEVVVTHMATKEFPFIRYRTGDVAILDDEVCPCGRGLPLLKEIQGRTTDFVVAKDGTVMHGLALIYILRDSSGVKLFKIIQESVDHIRILLIVDEEFTTAIEANVVKQFKKRLGESVEVSIDKVEDILPEKNGKYRYVISHVQIS
jgi:phenylacetate-CoA ligase